MRVCRRVAVGLTCLLWAVSGCEPKEPLGQLADPSMDAAMGEEGDADRGAETRDLGGAASADMTLPMVEPDAGRPVAADAFVDARLIPEDAAPAPEDALVRPDARQVVDVEAPWWPAGAAVFIERLAPHEALIAWSHALDGQGVTAYVVFESGVEVGRVRAPETRYLAANLFEGGEYTVGVMAEDAAGNRSEMLSLTFRTDDASAPTWAENAVLRKRHELQVKVVFDFFAHFKKRLHALQFVIAGVHMAADCADTFGDLTLPLVCSRQSVLHTIILFNACFDSLLKFSGHFQ